MSQTPAVVLGPVHGVFRCRIVNWWRKKWRTSRKCTQECRNIRCLNHSTTNAARSSSCFTWKSVATDSPTTSWFTFAPKPERNGERRGGEGEHRGAILARWEMNACPLFAYKRVDMSSLNAITYAASEAASLDGVSSVFSHGMCVLYFVEAFFRHHQECSFAHIPISEYVPRSGTKKYPAREGEP